MFSKIGSLISAAGKGSFMKRASSVAMGSAFLFQVNADIQNSKGKPVTERVGSAIDSVIIGSAFIPFGLVGGTLATGGYMLARATKDIIPGTVNAYRGMVSSRTTLHVPFSSSRLNVNQAGANLQYAQSRMSEMYGRLDNTATMFHARYLQR